MPSPSQDPGPVVRWYIFIPRQGKFLVPPGVSGPDRLTWATSQGATRLFRGSELVWSRPVGVLAVVR